MRGGDAAFDAICRRALAGESGGVDASQDAEMLVSQRTQLLNGLRGHLTEVGVIAAQGPRHREDGAKDETARRLMSIPGFGPITASAMAATIQDASSFAGPREFAAFLGLTPKQNSSGGKQRLGRISKMGNRNLRKLLVVGAHAVPFHR